MARFPRSVSLFQRRFPLFRSSHYPFSEPHFRVLRRADALNPQCGRIGRGIVQLRDISLRFRCDRNEDTLRGKPLVNWRKGEW
jgi:hypothetical protein